MSLGQCRERMLQFEAASADACDEIVQVTLLVFSSTILAEFLTSYEILRYIA